MHYETPGQDSPAIDLDHEKNLQDLLVSLAGKKLVHSAHDISDGGLFVALAEKSIMNAPAPLGFKVELEDSDSGPYHIQQQLFSEAQGRVILSIAPDNAREVIEAANKHNVPVRVIGKVVDHDAVISINGEEILHFQIEELTGAYYHSLEHALHLDELL